MPHLDGDQKVSAGANGTAATHSNGTATDAAADEVSAIGAMIDELSKRLNRLTAAGSAGPNAAATQKLVSQVVTEFNEYVSGAGPII